MRRFNALVFALLWVAVPAISAAAAEPEGIYCFSKEALSPDDQILTGVCITGLPGPEEGFLLLGTRRIRVGDVLTAGQLEEMTFVSAGVAEEAEIRYLPVFSDGVSAEAVFSFPVRSRNDQPPLADDQTVETYRNLPVEGLLTVTDPEESPLRYTLTRQPRRGSVIVREDGSFLYTPEKNKVGTDSFTYTAADDAGNTSREATVVVRILKPADNLQYSDTQGLSCRFEAEWLRSEGIFTGEMLSGQLCFFPTEGVSRGQFLVMLMQTLGLPGDTSAAMAEYPGLPLWLSPCLAAAVRAGIVPEQAGINEADRPWEALITGQEAAVLIRNALDFSVPAAVEPDGSLAVWAVDAVAAVGREELTLPHGGALVTRADAAKVLYQISKLRSTGFWEGLFG